MLRPSPSSCAPLFALLVAGLAAPAARGEEGGGAPLAEGPLPSPPATLPQVISVPGPTRGVTVKYYVAVEGGRVWLKLNPDWTPPPPAPDAGAPARFAIDTQATREWTLLDRTGIPVVEGVASPITELSIDDERIIAVAETGELVRYEDGVWNRPWGLPLPMPGFLKPLSLPADVTTWTLSMRHSQVEYYEDPKGNQFNWGAAGCTTVFALRGDGSRIAQGDPWFPPDFSREMCGPRRGTFVSAGLASSASLTLVIDRAGTVFTRFYDYDINGGTPFFQFRYEAFEKQPLPGTNPESETQLRQLPEEGWTEQPRIPSVGQTRLTRNVAVLQNGKGNWTRELRVQAKGPDGASGYFTKALRDPAWTFRATGEPLAERDFIDNDPAKTVSAPSRDRLYSGVMLSHGRRVRHVAYATIPDLNFHCGPARLELVLEDGASIGFTLHLVDSWTLFENQDPEDTPNAYKTHKVTVELSPETRASTDERVRAVIDRYFSGVHLQPFKFELVANSKELRLFPVGYRRIDPNEFELRLRAAGADPRIFPYREKYQAYVGHPETCVPIDVFQGLLRERTDLDDRVSLTSGLSTVLPTGTSLADLLSVLTTTRWTVSKLKTLGAFEEHLPGLTAGMERSFRLYRERSADDFSAVRAMLHSRLCAGETAKEKKETFVPSTEPKSGGGGRGRGSRPGGGLSP